MCPEIPSTEYLVPRTFYWTAFVTSTSTFELTTVTIDAIHILYLVLVLVLHLQSTAVHQIPCGTNL